MGIILLISGEKHSKVLSRIGVSNPSCSVIPQLTQERYDLILMPFPATNYL